MGNRTIGRWLAQEPVGFNAGDANLYRYVGNDPANAADPTGLAAAPIPAAGRPDILVYPQSGVQAGKLTWPINKPTPPAGLGRTLTLIDMNWQIRSSRPMALPPVNGSYRFWLDGIAAPNDLEFNMGPGHASRWLVGKRMPPWPYHATRKEADEYLRNSVALEGTVGRLSVVLEFRGYKERGAHPFQPALGKDAKYEPGGPFEHPGRADGVERSPNRLRTPFRPLAPWSAAKPAFWDKAVAWTHRLTLEVSWDWTGKNLVVLYRTTGPNGESSGNASVREVKE